MSPSLSLATAAGPVSRWSRERPRAVAVIENNAVYTYSDLARNIVQAARTLAAAGVRPGTIVGVECDARYLMLVLLLACEVLGATHVTVGVSDLTRDNELARRCDLLCAEHENELVVDDPRMICLSRAFVRTMTGIAIGGDDLEWLDRTFPAGDIVRIGRTSGTTGRPKFVFYSRGALQSLFGAIPRLLDGTPRDFIAFYGFFQIGTYTRALSTLRDGMTVEFSRAVMFAETARRHAASHTFLLVRDAAVVAGTEQFRGGRVDACSLLVHGGFLPPKLRAALRETVTVDVRSLYSMNETSIIMVNDGDGPGTVLPGVSVRIVDEDAIDTRPGLPGRILARTPWMASGYLWDDAQTRAQFVDGWFLTSDIGFMPEAGKLMVLGRADDMINLGGIKFAPLQLEDPIRALDGVTDVVALSMDNEIGTGELHIFVERDDSARDRALWARIVPLVGGPFRIYFVSDLPRTGTGKVRRDLVRQSLG